MSRTLESKRIHEDGLLYPKFLPSDQATQLLETLWTDVLWHSSVLNADMKDVPLSRSMAYMHDPVVDYLYAGMILPGTKLTAEILELIHIFQDDLGLTFNSALLNLYKDGRDKINWHSDKEDQLGPRPIIGSLNLGATRKFHFLRKSDGEKMFVELSHGDFFVMEENCQVNFLHAILPEKEVKDPRLSLTFRKVTPYHKGESHD